MKTLVNIDQNANEEAKRMLSVALSMCENKTGMIRANGKHECIDAIRAGIRHNEYASTIYLLNHQGYALAYFCGNQFWSMTTKTLVTLQ